MTSQDDVQVRLVSGSPLDAVSGGEELLAQASTGLIYATSTFIRLLGEALDADARWLVAERNGRVTGLLPFLEKQGGCGSVINSLPFFGSHGGPIVAPGEEVSALQLTKEYAAYAENLNGLLAATLVENPLAPLARGTDGYSALGHATDVRISQITPLDVVTTATDLLQRFDDPRPRNIRKAIKVGVTVSEDRSDKAFAFLIETHISNMSAIGGLAKQPRFFDLIRTILRPDDWRLHVASLDREPVAALLTLRNNKTVEYFTPVIREEFRSTQALSYVIFEAMLEAAQEGYARWNWGGTWLSQGGVYDFKRKWGAQERRYEYFTQIYDRAVFDIAPERRQREYPYFYLYPFEMSSG